MPASWNDIFQNCWYVGNNFNCILYGMCSAFYNIPPARLTRDYAHFALPCAGVELVLYFTTVKLVLDRRTRHKRADLNDVTSEQERKCRVVLSLSTGLLCMITIYLFAQNFFGQEMWIIHEGYSGGSGQYYADHAAVWYQTMGSASSVVMNWMSDAYFVCIIQTGRLP